jgi:hypothetical protein
LLTAAAELGTAAVATAAAAAAAFGVAPWLAGVLAAGATAAMPTVALLAGVSPMPTAFFTKLTIFCIVLGGCSAALLLSATAATPTEASSMNAAALDSMVAFMLWMLALIGARWPGGLWGIWWLPTGCMLLRLLPPLTCLGAATASTCLVTSWCLLAAGVVARRAPLSLWMPFLS